MMRPGLHLVISTDTINFIFSGGSDKYSVVADNNNKHDEQADSADTDSYAIIDMTDPIPICVNYPVGPDIIKDLPGTANKSSKKVVRSSSFLTQNTGFIAICMLQLTIQYICMFIVQINNF